MESEEESKRLEELHTTSVENRQKLIEIEQQNESFRSENAQLKQDHERHVSEIADLSDIVNRRDQELKRSEDEKKEMREELSKANASKCDALIRIEDVAAKEVSLAYREKRLEDDRELMQQHINTLTEDLHTATERATVAQREQITKVSQLQTALEERQGHIRLLEGREEALKADKEVIQERLDSLWERLKDARDSNTHLEEGYNEEIRAQTHIANLYKTKAADAEEMSSELANAVKELQELLKHSAEKYGSLEDSLEKEKLDNKEEIRRRNEAIRGLKKELDDANELINTLKYRGLVEDGINQLSPAAAAASKIVKSGMSLTQVYTQLVSCKEELLNAKDENRRLNSYIEQILSDVEERAPAFKRQQDDYDRALEKIEDMKLELEKEKESHESGTLEAEMANRKLSAAARQNTRFQKQIKDLSTQVVTLVREVEAARFGRSTKNEDVLASPRGYQATAAADGVISERLVSFHDVSELQQKNVELLAVIREMTSNQDKAETQLVEEKTLELKRELETVTSRVEKLREARHRQETLMDDLVLQRDMYKSLAEGNAEPLKELPKAASTPGMTLPLSMKEQNLKLSPPVKEINNNAYRELEIRAAKSEAALAEVKKDFDIYREEKYEHEKMITEMLDKTREELHESRSKAIKLASQEEWNTERFKLAQTNAAKYKKEIGVLDERNKALHVVIAKHESAIDALHKELLNSQTMLSKVERSYERAQNETRMLNTAELRLQQECESLHRQKTGSALIAENLKLVQVQLEKGESEAKTRLQNENDAFQKEVVHLKKKLNDELDTYKANVQVWESSQKELRGEIEGMKSKELQTQKALEESLAAQESTTEQLKATEEKLKQMQNSHLSKHIVSLQNQLKQQSTKSAEELANVLRKFEASKASYISKIHNEKEKQKEREEEYEKLLDKCNKAEKKEVKTMEVLVAAKEQITSLTGDNARLKEIETNAVVEKEQLREQIASLTQELQNTKGNFETQKQQLIAEHQQQLQQLKQSSEDTTDVGPTPSTSGTAMVSFVSKRSREEADVPFVDAQKKARQEAADSPLHKNDSPSGSGTLLLIASPSTPSRENGITEPATSSTVQGEDEDIAVVDSNASVADDEEVDEEEELNERKDLVEHEEENDEDEDDTNVDDEEEVEEESEFVDDRREKMQLEDNDQDESDVHEEEEQDSREGIDEGEEDEVIDDENEENEADSVGQDPQGAHIPMSLSATIAAPLVPSESQPTSDVGSSEVSEGQALPQQNQSSEIVTSSSGSNNPSSQQSPNETSSSTSPATQSHGTRGSGSDSQQRSQRRGIQRQPIVWDNTSYGASR